jgi:hypothetical protein
MRAVNHRSGKRIVLLERDPDMGNATLLDWVLDGADAPETHDASAIADAQGSICRGRLQRRAAASGDGRRSQGPGAKPDLLLLMSRPTISTSRDRMA